MNHKISIVDRLDFSPGTVDVQESGHLSALKDHYLRQLRAHHFDIDQVYFSGEFPSVYFKKVSDFSESVQREILSVHKKIWNQGKVPFLYVESTTEVRVYNCYEKPVNYRQEDRNLSDLELYQTALDELDELERVFDKVSIETGRFWQEKQYAEQVSGEHRIEEELISNLKKTRQKLLETGLSISIIHDLLLRSLFILYLEDRKATDTSFYQKVTGLKSVTSYFDILDNKAGTYRLFAELEDRFNGNLCPIGPEEQMQVSEGHLKQIKACFWAELQTNGQLQLFDWRLFDFEVIPIQLLSEIYEEFLEVADKEGKNKTGAYYTPHPLAEFVLNELLPYPAGDDDRHDFKILDPTCGSGIFLVESLNRLLDRWEAGHPDETLSFEIICQIVSDHIFGIEINPEATKVAAFSLYLAMLNRLEPKTLWQNRRFPYLIFDPDEENESKQGHNLFRMSSLGKGPFENLDFDLVVGNPPFGRGRLGAEAQGYLDQRDYARELVLAFLDRVTVLAPSAKYGLICGSKPVLFNNGIPYQNFRRFLFNETYVEKVFNFSILRRGSKKEGGRNLFASATNPVSVIFYSKQFPVNPSDKLFYCAPKTAIKNRIIDGIAIDKTDIKYLPRAICQQPDTKIWKVAMWGTERDFGLVSNFSDIQSIETTIDTRKDLKKGGGFQTSKPIHSIDDSSVLSEIPYLPAKYVARYFSKIDNTIQNPFSSFERLGTETSYLAPHLLIKTGQSKKRFCSSFLDFDCSFTKTIYGIHSLGDDSYLKVLSSFLNSGFATYLLFLTSASWGVEREEVKPNETLNLPDVSILLDTQQREGLVNFIDQIIKIKKANLIGEAQLIAELEQKIEATLWDALSLSETERILIEDLLTYNLDAFQNKQKSVAFRPCRLADTQQYATYLCRTINEFLDYGEELSAWSAVFELNSRIPLNMVIVYFNTEKEADTVTPLPEKEIGQVLKRMDRYTYEQYAESIYYRKFLRYYADDKLYIIKPNEKRFWSRSLGINDADEIIAEVLVSGQWSVASGQ